MTLNEKIEEIKKDYDLSEEQIVGHLPLFHLPRPLTDEKIIELLELIFPKK